jgi:hypothetical protein
MDRPVNVSIKAFNYKNNGVSDFEDLKSIDNDKSTLFGDKNSWDYLRGESNSNDSASSESNDSSSMTSESSSKSSDSSSKESVDIVNDENKFKGVVELKELFSSIVNNDTLNNLPVKLIQEYVDNYKLYKSKRIELLKFLKKNVDDPKKIEILVNRLENVPFYSTDVVNLNFVKTSQVNKKIQEIPQSHALDYFFIVLKILVVFFIILVVHYVITNKFSK